VFDRLTLQGAAPLLRHETKPRSWDLDLLDLSCLTWTTPFDVAAIAALWRTMEVARHPPRVLMLSDPTVRAYLVDMGLPQVLPGEWGSGGGWAIDPPWLALFHVASSDVWDDLQGELWLAASFALGSSSLLARSEGFDPPTF